MPWLRSYRVPAEWPFCWREPQHRNWLTLEMSQSNPSAALALYSLLGPRATVASVQSGRSDAIVTRGTVPAEWPFCWQVRAARPAQHRTWRPLGLPQSSFGRVHPFRNQGGRSHSCQRAPTYSLVYLQLHIGHRVLSHTYFMCAHQSIMTLELKPYKI